MIEADRARIAEAITALEANSPDLKAALEALKHTCTQYHL
jgi:hypothetical protein